MPFHGINTSSSLVKSRLQESILFSNIIFIEIEYIKVFKLPDPSVAFDL
jgi:hypothetical protein